MHGQLNVQVVDLQIMTFQTLQLDKNVYNDQKDVHFK
jgi:hypothetical protein